MDRTLLAAQLAAGRSIESIARDAGHAPSTVAYWVNEHGLTSQHAARHAPRGAIVREELEALLAEELSIRAMAGRLGVSYTTVRHWLRRYDIVTPARAGSRRPRRRARPGRRQRRPTVRCTA